MTDDPSRKLSHSEIQQMIARRGGAVAVATALGMDPRNMQRIYAGKRHASPTLLRRIYQIPPLPGARAALGLCGVKLPEAANGKA